MKNYKICSRCVMDSNVPNISFDVNGICNYCTNYLSNSSNVIFEDIDIKKEKLRKLCESIKKDGKNKPYDCIIGVSGGVDSSWVLVQAIEMGLRPLAVHMDNGWNSELAQNNIENLISKLGVDLYTYVIDWDEYRSLMQAFFDADVIDIELLYDNATLAVNYAQAHKYGIKYILSGSNQATEGMPLPAGWNWFKLDKKNIYSIARKFGVNKIKSFPSIGTYKYIYYEYVKNIKWIAFLDSTIYNKFDALNELEIKYNYKRYPYKHYESIFTRFYQGYILPNKFKIDKRLVHMSTLVMSGQMKRVEALFKLKGIAYPTDKELQNDINYFLKKMSWSTFELENYLLRPEIKHNFYSTEKPLWDFIFGKFREIIPKKIKKLISRNNKK